jgi:hypothetical protein
VTLLFFVGCYLQKLAIVLWLLTAFVDEQGQATVTELADTFKVSADTVRRDLDWLAHLQEAQMMAEMIESAQRTIVVMHSSKFGRSAFAHIVRLDAIELLITDRLPEPELRDALAAAEVEIVVASGLSRTHLGVTCGNALWRTEYGQVNRSVRSQCRGRGRSRRPCGRGWQA